MVTSKRCNQIFINKNIRECPQKYGKSLVCAVYLDDQSNAVVFIMNSDVIKKSIEISKELETINFKALLLKYPQLKNKKDSLITVFTKGKVKRWSMKKNKVSPESNKAKENNVPSSQLASFLRAMKLLLIVGQVLGLNPVQGILETDVKNMRFTIWSWRSLYCITIGIAQTIATILCFHRFLKESITVGALGFFSFYAATFITTFFFIYIGAKWPKLMKDLSKSRLDEYIDPRLKVKCYTISIIIVTFGMIEHLLSLLSQAMQIINCKPDARFYDEFIKNQFPWFFDLNVPRIVPIGVVLQILNAISTISWNYSDLFIVCMSMYLTSILDQINKKIVAASKKHYLSASHWRELREDYNRATRLVRSFDDVFSCIIFTSFANNLFFICLQLFNILAHGVKKQVTTIGCPNMLKGPLGGHEDTIYLLFSVAYLLARWLTVSLVAARVNTASLVPAPAMYSVPSSAFSDEVSRFIDQVHGDTVALSGLKFFFVTRELVLSVAGTIVTYELVLLQFSSEEMDG